MGSAEGVLFSSFLGAASLRSYGQQPRPPNAEWIPLWPMHPVASRASVDTAPPRTAFAETISCGMCDWPGAVAPLRPLGFSMGFPASFPPCCPKLNLPSALVIWQWLNRNKISELCLVSNVRSTFSPTHFSDHTLPWMRSTSAGRLTGPSIAPVAYFYLTLQWTSPSFTQPG